jgi:predicted nuclease of predicted toxin-antitoxin system
LNLFCDEGVPRPIVEHLRREGHHVLYVAELDPSIDDEAVLARAVELAAPLVTTDKDFGELVFRQGRATSGVVLLRLAGLSNEAKASIVASALREHAQELVAAFTVILQVESAYVAGNGRARVTSKHRDSTQEMCNATAAVAIG